MAKRLIRRAFALVLLGFAAIAVQAAPLKPTSDGWLAFGGLEQGCNGDVLVSAIGPTGELYIGGSFTSCGGVPAQNIARYQNGSFSSLGVGLDNDALMLMVSGSTLYVGGSFTQAGGQPANHIAQWNINASTWSSLGSGAANGVDSTVYGLAITDTGSTLYVGGSFTQAGGQPANHIAQWDINGSTWSSLGSGPANGVADTVYTLAVPGNSTVYVGGSFTQAGGQPANHIAQWDINGSTWSSLGSGPANGVNSNVWWLVFSEGSLYVGGEFTQAGGQVANHIAQWSGSTWSSLGSGSANGVADTVYMLAAAGGYLYVGGDFTQAGGQAANRIAQWNINTSTWNPLVSGAANGVGSRVFGLALSGSTLYVGGTFTQAGGQPANHIAQWDINGSTWNPIPINPNTVSGTINALDVAPGIYLFVGGAFTQAGGQISNNVALWNIGSSTWTPINGTDGPVNALKFDSRPLELYVGGQFAHAGGQPMSHIGEWHLSGSTWNAFGAGTNNTTVNALLVSDIFKNLYVGGDFTQAGGQFANYIAQWNGTNWSALSDGTDNGVSATVRALVLGGNTLYAGGVFNFIGDGGTQRATNRIAQWDRANSTWSALDDGVSNGVAGNVSALAYNPTRNWLAVGGNFTTGPANPGTACLAMWIKTQNIWIPVAVQPTAFVDNRCEIKALAWMGDDLYVGGSGLAANNTDPDNYLVRLSMSSAIFALAGNRSSVGRGVNGPVNALAADTGRKRLYVGGSFDQAGGQLSSNIAIAETDVIFRNSFETP